MNYKYIIVDDDHFNNLACSQTISKVIDGAEVTCFEYPAMGLQYIASEYVSSHRPTILLLDINMPLINGWDFLDAFAKMDTHIQKQFTIYIISSSIEPEDKKRALINKYVTDFLPKPVSVESIRRIASV